MAEGWVTIADKVNNQKLGYQGTNNILQQIRACAFRVFPLGGSRTEGIASASYVPVKHWIPLVLDGTKLAGFVVTARVWVRTDNAGTSVTPRVWNNTTSTAAGTGVACIATDTDDTGDDQEQLITLTLAAGENVYILQIDGNNATDDIFGLGVIEVSLP